jgi:hypothetical protein
MDPLETTIQEAMTRGRLPRIDCLATWFGSGRGQRCAGCDERILGSQVAVDCDLPDGLQVFLHARCYELWRTLLAA